MSLVNDNSEVNDSQKDLFENSANNETRKQKKKPSFQDAATASRKRSREAEIESERKKQKEDREYKEQVERENAIEYITPRKAKGIQAIG